jgi:signal transduction histidine kinase
MSRPMGVHTTLATRVLIRLGWTAFAVIAANVIYALAHNVFDTNHLSENIVRGETRRIAGQLDAGLQAGDVGDDRPVVRNNGVSYRILDPSKTIEAGRNQPLVERVSASVLHDPQSAVFQVSHVTVDGQDYIWGLARHVIAGREVLVEVALPAGTKRAAWHAFADELSLHVWVPIIPSALAFLLLAHWSVHSGLAPLSKAINAIKGAEVVRGPPPKLADERLTSEIETFLLEVEAAFSKHSTLLRAQQEFVGRVAHELRTPLTLMTLDLAAIDGPKARAVERDVNELSDKITKMLAWARMDLAGQKYEEAIDLTAVAADAAAGLRRLSDERGIAVELSSDGEAVTSGDRNAIKEAVRNMIENAIKHTPGGSRVTVTAGPGPRIIVADNGSGFPNVDSVLLLQPFWKGDANTDGAGLGLALVKRVADSHGARIMLGKSADGGAEISLRFPTLQPSRA